MVAGRKEGRQLVRGLDEAIQNLACVHTLTFYCIFDVLLVGEVEVECDTDSADYKNDNEDDG